jgi:hypothetical protein
MADAYKDLMEHLEEGEKVEAIVFGSWGWDGYKEPEGKPVPKETQCKILTIDDARPMMWGWSFYGGFGSPTCYAVHVWTDRRVIWVNDYDGATRLVSVPRNPTDREPEMSGGS